MEIGFRFDCDDSCFFFLLFFNNSKVSHESIWGQDISIENSQNIKLIIKLGKRGEFDLDEFEYGGKG